MTPRFKTDPLKKQLPDSKRCEFKESDGSRCENEALYFVTYNDKRVRCCAVDWRNWNQRLIRHNKGAMIDGGRLNP